MIAFKIIAKKNKRTIRYTTAWRCNVQHTFRTLIAKGFRDFTVKAEDIIK